MLSLNSASAAEQDILMDIAGVGLCHISLNREVVFTQKVWKSKHMLFRRNIPVLIKEVPSFKAMTIKYWEPSKDKIVKADVNELLPAPLCDHLEITPKIIQKLVEFSMSENLLQASIQV